MLSSGVSAIVVVDTFEVTKLSFWIRSIIEVFVDILLIFVRCILSQFRVALIETVWNVVQSDSSN